MKTSVDGPGRMMAGGSFEKRDIPKVVLYFQALFK
jgi:hypothetical protein